MNEYQVSIYGDGIIYFNKPFFSALGGRNKYVKLAYWEEQNTIIFEFLPAKIEGDLDNYFKVSKSHSISGCSFLKYYNIYIIDKFIPIQKNIPGLGLMWTISLNKVRKKHTSFFKCIPYEELPEDHFVRQVVEDLPMLFNELGENI